MKQVFNPYMPLHECVPDGEPHVFGDRVYVYGSHDKEGGDFFCMLDYVCYSAPIDNLKDWRYEGVIYKASQDPDYVNHRYMYAPDVVRGNDGKYYLFYSLADRHECSFLMSVAVCDTPCGKYEFLGYVKWPDGRPLQEGVIFDPGLINDNGHVYLYYGVWYEFDENPKFSREESIQKQMEMYKKSREEIENTPGGVMGPFVVELCDDMLTVKGRPKHIFPTTFKGTKFEGYEFFEASSMRKVGDKYYFVYSTYNQHELAYATSDYPDRDFEFGGVIISNGDIGLNGRKKEDRLRNTGNNHGSIENINGEWYVFYHRQTHRNEYSRQACAEKIEILENGFIPQVEVTSCGLNGGPLVSKGTYPSPICCNLTNGKMVHGRFEGKILPHITNDGEERFVTEIDNGTKIGYKYFKFENVNKIGIKYRSGEIAPCGEILIKLGLDENAISKIEINGSDDWKNVNAPVEIANATVAPLFFEYRGEGLIDIIEFYFE